MKITGHTKAVVEKKTGYRHIWLFDPIFRTNVDIVIGPSCGKDIEEWLKRGYNIEFNSRVGEFYGRTLSMDGGLNVCIFIREGGITDPEFLASLAHEAFHAAHMILSHRGQPNGCEDGEETHAYVIGWIVREVVAGLIEIESRTRKPKSRKK